ncbi:hypothetical protein M1P56_23130 [Streptomyces sp. HU2014]|nr:MULTISPECIES: hypothetical protein [Streptomyces]UQI47032.1 hypothetical protein M1P56_23130 [Streptomyces sp. HU2014]
MRRRTPILAMTALAALAVGTVAAAADGPEDKPGIVAPSKQKAERDAEPLAAHGQFFGDFVTVEPNTNRSATVSCPTGQVPTGGGGTTSAIRIFFTDSFASGRSWVVRGTNTNSVNESIRAFVVCTTP